MGPDGPRRIFLKQQDDQPHRPGGKFLRYAGSQSMLLVDIADEFDGFHGSTSIRGSLNRLNRSKVGAQNSGLAGGSACPTFGHKYLNFPLDSNRNLQYSNYGLRYDAR